MLGKLRTKTLKEFRSVYKADDSKFMLFTGLKVTGISILITITIYFFLFEFMRLNYAFFRANCFPEFADINVFYNYVGMEALNNLPLFFVFHVFLFFIGYYVGWLMLRPFNNIGEYCENVLENPNTIYRVDEFSTYRLLIIFSEFFFEFLRESRKKGELAGNSIPPQYSKIHKPVLDKIFMLHFGILLVVVGISSAVFIIENTTSIFESMGDLASKTLPNNNIVQSYLSAQDFIIEDIFYLTILLVSFFYMMLGLHLYNKVSGAAFGIFSTMRAFMKGNHFSRVHLVGYSHVREHTRKLNKYLDYIQNNLSKDKPKG